MAPTFRVEDVGCCSTCCGTGRGGGPETNGLCWDCHGTGCACGSCDWPLDVDEIERRWLQPCGSCDAGLTTSCRCPDEDPRAVISDLAAEVRRLRG